MTVNGGVNWLETLSKQMKNDVGKGEPPTPETMTARSLMEKFGYERRGRWIVGYINRQMRRLDLMTIPELDHGWIDSHIAITLRTHEEGAAALEAQSDEPQQIERVDPTLRISSLEEVINEPIGVNPNAELREATTIMLRHDFSQLPVMEGPRTVRGIISWESIGTRLSLNVENQKVRDFMESERLNEKIIASDRPLLEAISLVTEHGYILVRGSDNTITGIITATDLSDQFRQLSEPFLLIGEIEGHLRNVIGMNFTIPDIKHALGGGESVDHINGPEDLSFGQYWYLLEKEERWANVGLNIDRVQFVGLMKAVNEVRNDVMHFRPLGLSDEDRGILNDAVRLLHRLAQLDVI